MVNKKRADFVEVAEHVDIRVGEYKYVDDILFHLSHFKNDNKWGDLSDYPGLKEAIEKAIPGKGLPESPRLAWYILGEIGAEVLIDDLLAINKDLEEVESKDLSAKAFNSEELAELLRKYDEAKGVERKAAELKIRTILGEKAGRMLARKVVIKEMLAKARADLPPPMVEEVARQMAAGEIGMAVKLEVAGVEPTKANEIASETTRGAIINEESIETSTPTLKELGSEKEQYVRDTIELTSKNISIKVRVAEMAFEFAKKAGEESETTIESKDNIVTAVYEEVNRAFNWKDPSVLTEPRFEKMEGASGVKARTDLAAKLEELGVQISPIQLAEMAEKVKEMILDEEAGAGVVPTESYFLGFNGGDTSDEKLIVAREMAVMVNQVRKGIGESSMARTGNQAEDEAGIQVEVVRAMISQGVGRKWEGGVVGRLTRYRQKLEEHGLVPNYNDPVAKAIDQLGEAVVKDPIFANKLRSIERVSKALQMTNVNLIFGKMAQSTGSFLGKIQLLRQPAAMMERWGLGKIALGMGQVGQIVDGSIWQLIYSRLGMGLAGGVGGAAAKGLVAKGAAGLLTKLTLAGTGPIGWVLGAAGFLSGGIKSAFGVVANKLGLQVLTKNFLGRALPAALGKIGLTAISGGSALLVLVPMALMKIDVVKMVTRVVAGIFIGMAVFLMIGNIRIGALKPPQTGTGGSLSGGGNYRGYIPLPSWTPKTDIEGCPNGLPVDGTITQGPNATSCSHEGKYNMIDIATANDTPVKATHGGVTRVGFEENGYGVFVAVTSVCRTGGKETMVMTIYGHLRPGTVDNGKEVAAGDVVGLSDNTGNSTGPHVHYEIRGLETPQFGQWEGCCVNTSVRCQ